MTNKIDGYGIQPTAGPRTAAVAPVGRSGAQGSNAASPVASVSALDSVALTEDAQNLQNLEQKIASLPAEDHERIEKIRAQIADGTYQINPKTIAERLARMEWELGS